MPRFFILLPLTTLFFGLSIIAILIGHQQPPSTWAQILHLDDCELPCWIGIVPGQTTLAEAQKQIERVYGNSSVYQLQKGQGYQVFDNVTGAGFIAGFWVGNGMQPTDATIKQITLFLFLGTDTSNKRPTIPDLHEVLGNPVAVALSTDGRVPVIDVLYEDKRINVFVSDLHCDTVLFKQEIASFELWDQAQIDRYPWLSNPHPWRGYNRCYSFGAKLSP